MVPRTGARGPRDYHRLGPHANHEDENALFQALAAKSPSGAIAIGVQLSPPGFAQKASQDSTGSTLPCLTMISWGETGAEVSLPANFGPATVAMDHTTARIVMTTIAARMMSLRISVSLVSR